MLTIMGNKKPPKFRETIYFSERAHAALKKWKARYPAITYSDIASGAMIFLDRQARMGLDAECQPYNPTDYTEEILQIVRQKPPKKTGSDH